MHHCFEKALLHSPAQFTAVERTMYTGSNASLTLLCFILITFKNCIFSPTLNVLLTNCAFYIYQMSRRACVF